MKRKLLMICLSLLLALGLSACGEEAPPAETADGPGRMVRSIEVAIHPEDNAFDRTYVTQENMNALLALLRSMQTAVEPEQTPDLQGGQSYYTATVTFTNGQQSVYYLLGHTYLRLGQEDWCVVNSEQAKAFNTFLREHPSDESPTEPTAVPTETSEPTE